MKKLIAGNWKMNGSLTDAAALATDIAAGIKAQPALLNTCDFTVCPPFLHLAAAKTTLNGASVAFGGQDCSPHDNGARTGDVSAAMLKDAGCTTVILGHSERRHGHGESDSLIAAKAAKAHAAGLIAIICVGETEIARDCGQAEDIVGRQLNGSIPASATAENTVIAYEPVWAIGTGKTATPNDVKAMHEFIRAELAKKIVNSASVRILYGGSVKPDNAKELLAVPNVNGALIGGASLKAKDYLAIASESE